MKNVFKKLGLLFAAAVGMVSNASAALTATDVDFAPAIADIGIVFIAILGVGVVIFGYKKIRGMIKA